MEGAAHPAQAQGIKTARLIVQSNRVGLAQPIHQQRHGGWQVVMIQQHLDHAAVCLRRMKLFDVRPPECHLPSGFAGFVPRRQCCGNVLRRLHRLGAGNRSHAADRAGRKPIPPGGQLAKRRRNSFFQLVIVARGRRVPQPGVKCENLLDQIQQFIDARIGNAVLHRREQAELAAEAEDVPRIEHRAAFDGSAQQILHLRHDSQRFVQPIRIDRPMPAGQQALHLANHSARCGGYDVRLTRGRLGKAEPGE